MKPAGKPPPKVLGEPLVVLNVGLELFAETLQADGVRVVHVDWRPPAGGDARMAQLLARMNEQ